MDDDDHYYGSAQRDDDGRPMKQVPKVKSRLPGTALVNDAKGVKEAMDKLGIGKLPGEKPRVLITDIIGVTCGCYQFRNCQACGKEIWPHFAYACMEPCFARATEDERKQWYHRLNKLAEMMISGKLYEED